MSQKICQRWKMKYGWLCSWDLRERPRRQEQILDVLFFIFHLAKLIDYRMLIFFFSLINTIINLSLQCYLDGRSRSSVITGSVGFKIDFVS